MSNSCLKPLPSNIGDELTSTYGVEYKQMISGIKTLTTSCPTKGGKSKRSRRTKKGGNMLSAQTFKYITYAIFTVIMGYMTAGGSIAMEGILNGLSAVFSGQCGTMGNQLWGIFGFANPVCAAYNSTMLLITNALSGSPMAWGALGSLVYATLKAPFILASSVKISTYLMARVIPTDILAPGQLQVLYQEASEALPQVLAITNPQQQQQIQNIFPGTGETVGQLAAAANNNDDLDAANALLGLRGSTGGKRRKTGKKAKKTKTVKKTKKSKKSKKSKKNKKTMKTKKAKKIKKAKK